MILDPLGAPTPALLAVSVIGGYLAGLVCVRLVPVLVARRRERAARGSAATFVFVDLVGYTALTDRRGDEAGARVAAEFQRLLSSISREHGAWHVKSMGDGAMIWAPDASRAISLAARALTDVGGRPDLLPVRVGAHTARP